MKNKLITSALAIILLLSVSSCKKDDNSSPDSNAALSTAIQQGQWKITNYNDSGNDETNHYTGYSFQFNSSGIVTAGSSGNNATGTWSKGNDDSQVKLVLDFGATSPFDELNDDWHVIEQNSSIIKLEDVSGGNGGTDYLTFEKI